MADLTGESEKKPHRTVSVERRAESRIPVPFIPVEVGEGPSVVPGVMLNLSGSGLLVQTSNSMDRHALIKTSFVLPGSKNPVACTAKVVWSRSVYGIHSRVGLRFAGLSADTAEAIRGYVRGQIAPRPMKGKRAEPRVPTPSIPVMIGHGREQLTGVMLDISRSGLLVQTGRAMEEGSVVNAVFILPETNGVVKCRARVVWRQGLYGSLENGGLMFEDAGPDTLKSIDTYIKTAKCGV